MQTEKKSDVTWNESEQLGPYRLQEQVAQAESGQGELYRATHELSGATALVLKPAPDDDSPPPTDWRVRCVSSASPSYLAFEVERSPWFVTPDMDSAEALVCMFEDVREGVRRMARGFSAPSKPRLGWRLGLGAAGVVAVCALVFALVRPAPVSQPVASAEPAPLRHQAPTDSLIPRSSESPLGGLPDAAPSALARSIPDRPYDEQKRPPCQPRIEVEIKGGCWIPHELKAPCPEPLYEYQGKCYMISFKPEPLPQSLGR